MRRFAQPALTAMALTLLLSCGGQQPQQTMFDPAGPMSARQEGLWWLTFWIAVAVFVVVITAFSTALSRNRVQDVPPPDIDPNPALERRYSLIVIVATGISVALLFTVLVRSVVASRYMNSLQSKNPVTVEVIGHQWWWEVQYPNPDPSQMVTTANEIHVPTGVPIVLETKSRDVIHSFWAPNIQGKRDLIPGHDSAIWFQVDRAGTYRGQCAEFCGMQHAHMAFYIVAESPEEFSRWLDEQRKAAPEPVDEVQKHGQEVFLKSTCVMCHAIRGTDAGAHTGPDLTHVGSRISLAAGTLPNTPGSLGGWIANPQSIKPGVRMPPNALPAEDLQALIQYLENLK